jgi:pimeloyl-ACP methyl ester carboxylesterase
VYRRRVPVALVALLAAVALVTSACSVGDANRVEKGTSAPPTSERRGSAGAPDLTWSTCGDVECATLEVPLSPGHPERGTIDLALARHAATGQRKGALLANPGGPGAQSLWLAKDAADIFPDVVLEQFDIVAWDPRGVGGSTAVDCADNLDFFWRQDRSPDTAKEVADNITAARRFARSCEARSARILPYLSTRNTVSDMEQIRRALGDEKLSYLGFSYGTLLGALYADRYPQRVRAMVLDGAIDPSLSAQRSSDEQALGFEHALDAFLTSCERDEDCDFYSGGSPRRAYDRVMAAIDAEPMFARVDGEERTLGPGEADLGVANALYAGRDGWPDLASALNAAARGDGSPLLELSDQYTGRTTGGDYTNETGAFYATGCLDAPPPADPRALQRDADAVARRAPHFGETTVWLGLPCVYWPAEPSPIVGPVHATDAPPIVVIGTTNDPATPYAWARSLADQLGRGRLVTLDDEGHAAYGRGNDCVDDLVHDYLLDLTVPASGTEC